MKQKLQFHCIKLSMKITGCSQKVIFVLTLIAYFHKKKRKKKKLISNVELKRKTFSL